MYQMVNTDRFNHIIRPDRYAHIFLCVDLLFRATAVIDGTHTEEQEMDRWLLASSWVGLQFVLRSLVCNAFWYKYSMCFQNYCGNIIKWINLTYNDILSISILIYFGLSDLIHIMIENKTPSMTFVYRPQKKFCWSNCCFFFLSSGTERK